MYLLELWFCRDIWPGVGLVDRTVTLLQGASILFSMVVVPTHMEFISNGRSSISLQGWSSSILQRFMSDYLVVPGNCFPGVTLIYFLLPRAWVIVFHLIPKRWFGERSKSVKLLEIYVDLTVIFVSAFFSWGEVTNLSLDSHRISLFSHQHVNWTSWWKSLHSLWLMAPSQRNWHKGTHCPTAYNHHP